MRYILEYSNQEIKENLKMDIERSSKICDLEDKVCFYLANGNMEQSLFWIRQIWELLGGEGESAEIFRAQTLRRSLMTIIRKINKIQESRLHTADAIHLFQLFFRCIKGRSKVVLIFRRLCTAYYKKQEKHAN